MIDPIRELKVRAELLQRAVQKSQPEALERLRALIEFRNVDQGALSAMAVGIQRKHCLATIARETGFANWNHAVRVLNGDTAEGDFGTLLYGENRGAQLNHWFANYEEASVFRRETGTSGARLYLLAYKQHCFVADRNFIESLGIDADDSDWAAIDWDWIRPQSHDARRRLYGKVISAKRALNP